VSVVLALLWLAAVCAIALTRARTGMPHAAALASSPRGVAHGEVWTLLTSGLVIAGPPAPELVGTALVVGGVLRALGGRRFWVVALSGHVGATLMAYAGIAVLAGAGWRGVDGAIDAPDYGISAVWTACLGALVAAVVRRRGRLGLAPSGLAVAGLAVFVVIVGQSWDLAGVEHVLAFVLGAAVVVLGDAPGARHRGHARRRLRGPAPAGILEAACGSWSSRTRSSWHR
jgi:hypothetical protein